MIQIPTAQYTEYPKNDHKISKESSYKRNERTKYPDITEVDKLVNKTLVFPTDSGDEQNANSIRTNPICYRVSAHEKIGRILFEKKFTSW